MVARAFTSMWQFLFYVSMNEQLTFQYNFKVSPAFCCDVETRALEDLSGIGLVIWFYYKPSLTSWILQNRHTQDRRKEFSHQRGKEGLVNILQHCCTSVEFRQHDMISWFGNYLTSTGFLTANHLALSLHLYWFTYHTSNLPKPSKQVQRLTGSFRQNP